MHRINASETPPNAAVAAMMRCESARLSFEEEMKSVLLVAGLFFLGLSLPALAQQTSHSSTSSSSAFPIGRLMHEDPVALHAVSSGRQLC